MFLVTMPPQCCRCNGKGRCRSCKCARDGVPCSNYTPGNNGRCENSSDLAPTNLVPAQTDNRPPTPPPNASMPPGALAENAPALAPGTGPMDADLAETGVPLLGNLTRDAEFQAPRNAPGPIPSHNLELSPTHPSPHPQAVLTNTLVHSIPPEHFPDLPSFIPMADPIFSWGSVDSESFSHSLNAAYAEIVHWRKNSFKVPFGKAGKDFVSELASLFRAFAEQSSLESVAFKSVIVFAILALQKPFRSSKSKDHTLALREDCLSGEMET